MSDPLSLVRNATLTGTAVNYVDNYYHFGAVKLHESTKTAFKRTLKTDEYYYSLRDVIFCLENIEDTVADYRRKAVTAKVTAVVEQDRQALRNYLTGVTDSCPQIDSVALNSYSQGSIARVTESATTETNSTLSTERMIEQREKHAALLEKSVQKNKTTLLVDQSPSTKSVSGLSSGKLEELKQLRRTQKRKSVNLTNEEDFFDKEFLEADKQILAKIRAEEFPSRTRTTVLSRRGCDFTFVLKQFNEKILKTKDQDAAKNKDGVKAPLPPNLPLPPLPQDKKFATPIIIVPNAVTSYINVVNAEDFLMKGKFIPVDQYGNKREKMKVATRVMPNGEMATYKIIDDGDKLKDSDWDRVVAVFATGKMWQFKTWKYNNPVDLFQQVLGVHLTYEDRVVDPNILSWNCKVLKVNPDKAHKNAASSKEFWMFFDDYIRLKKPWLLPPSHSGKAVKKKKIN